ncbi:MAG: hypothetical protein LBU35_02910 [Holosporales bacterium]|nr:hypothetical protein [Holosporales bacterium]
MTAQAVEKLKSLLALHDENCKGISITVCSGCCSGIDYTLSYEIEMPENKKSIEVDGINFFYDENVENVIRGLNIDLVENSFSHGFVVTNKNHVPCQNCTCQCGK